MHHRLAGLRPRAGGALLGADARDVRGASLRGLLEAGEAAQGLAAAAAIGDDRLQKMAGRRVAPESFTHGTSEQRMQWLTRGMQSGQLSACDTFGHGTLGP
ncbi:MAG: neutral zinc metallopeptidase [Myxococcales bacterium]|nr:neutral zinc metallopeptidase [Myxococcales bacterium]